MGSCASNTGLTNINSNLNNLIIIDGFSFDKGTIGANSYMYVTVNVSKTGYTPIGIIRLTNTGTGNAWLQIWCFYIEAVSGGGYQAVIGFANPTGSTNYTVKGTVGILYKHN